MEKINFYSSKNIRSKKATYNMIIGERSNGKTYDILSLAIDNYCKKNARTVYMRRYDDMLRPSYIDDIFTSLINNGVIEKISKGKYNTVRYYKRRWFLAYLNKETNEFENEDLSPFMYGLALNKMETIKSGFSDNTVTMIVFDEFLSREMYLKNEFIIFTNMLSTIIRERDNVAIFMLGNTVNKSCPYFDEMGLSNVKSQEQGTIDIYRYGDSRLTVAVEYCASIASQKKSNKYFAFDNPRLNMIVKGTWEIDNYPHPDFRVSKSQLVFDDIYVIFDGQILQIEIRCDSEHGVFTVVHPYTYDEIKNTEITHIYTTKFDSRKQFRYGMSKDDKVGELLWGLYYNKRFMYSDNNTGEILRNFINQTK